MIWNLRVILYTLSNTSLNVSQPMLLIVVSLQICTFELTLVPIVSSRKILVHERSIDSDFLLIILRTAWKETRYQDHFDECHTERILFAEYFKV